MRKIVYWVLGILSGAGLFLFGFLIRQPQINRLKKQMEFLQKDSSRLQELCQRQQNDFRNLLVQHKALKAFNFKKKSVSKDNLQDNLVLQYAIKEYLELLVKRVRYGQELRKDEIAFFNASENLIEGKKLSTSDKVKIKDYILERHSVDINGLQECDYTTIFQEMSSCGKAT